MNFLVEERKYKTLRASSGECHGPVRVLVKNGVKVDESHQVTHEMLKAAELRRAASTSEARVAPLLYKLGFLQSVPMHGYYLDFYNPELRICIEIDGPCHIRRKAKDKRRDSVLRSNGIRVWRFASHWAHGAPQNLANYVGKLLIKHRGGPAA